MTYRTLLVAVDQGTDSDARVSLACDLAAGMDAHLIGACGVTPAAIPVDEACMGSAMLGETLTLLRDLGEADVRSALKRFHELVGSRGDGAEWRGRLAPPADVIVQEARAADLVIMGRRWSRSPSHAADPAEVLMAIGRPVLVVPPRPDRGPTGWPAVIAWKDSRESRRAAAAALPLLRHASAVHVLEVCGDGAEAAAARTADVVAWLGRHGLAAEAHVASPGKNEVARTILDFADSRGAGLIISGGYGHARLREWALGGVTRDLLALSPVSVLFSH